MTPFPICQKIYLLLTLWEMFKGLHKQSLDVYQVRDTVLNSIYIKIAEPFSCTLFKGTVHRDGSG